MDSLLGRALEVLLTNPWAISFQLFVTVCLLTRVFTQISPNYRSASFKAGTTAIPRVPYWVPLLGNTSSLLFQQQSPLQDISRRLQAKIFGLKLYGRDYAVVTSPVLHDQLTDPSTPVSAAVHDRRRRIRFFANKYGSLTTIEGQSGSELNDLSTIRKLLHLLEIHSFNLISPSKSWVDQAQWERGASVEVVQEKPVLKVSTSLTRLVREFSAHMILSSLLSASFLEANSVFVADFLNFSSSYGMFMTGLPYWITPGLGPPALAREKCLLALDSLVEAISADVEGKGLSGTGAGVLYDLDDVHRAIWDIVKQVQQANTDTVARRTTRKCSCEILEAIWSTTFTSLNIVIWMVIYLFEKDGENRAVLEQIKTETQKVVKVIKPKPSGLLFEGPPRLEFTELKEQDELEKQCPTLYGAVLEVLRLEMEPEEYLTVQGDFILTADAAPDPNSIKKPALLSNVVERYQLVKGDRIYAAYGATYKDSYYWDRPRRFAPNRYGLAGTASTTQARLPRMSLTRHFGSLSPSIYIVVALLSFYEFEDVKHPGTKIVAGVGVPKGSLRANISRRKL